MLAMLTATDVVSRFSVAVFSRDQTVVGRNHSGSSPPAALYLITHRSRRRELATGLLVDGVGHLTIHGPWASLQAATLQVEVAGIATGEAGAARASCHYLQVVALHLVAFLALIAAVHIARGLTPVPWLVGGGLGIIAGLLWLRPRSKPARLAAGWADAIRRAAPRGGGANGYR